MIEKPPSATKRPKWAGKLALIRAMQELSQKDFAATIGVSEKAYQLYESGKREPSFATLKRIRDTYRISIDMLLFGGGIGSSGDDSDFDPHSAPGPERMFYLATVARASAPSSGASERGTQPRKQRQARTRALPKPE